jgi:hypothetical protein
MSACQVRFRSVAKHKPELKSHLCLEKNPLLVGVNTSPTILESTLRKKFLLVGPALQHYWSVSLDSTRGTETPC